MTVGSMDTIPAVYLVFNGPALDAARAGRGMSRAKIATQALQVIVRAQNDADWVRYAESAAHGLPAMYTAWQQWTTTIVRQAKTEKTWERVKSECVGHVMVDEGYTEVAPDTETCFLSVPMYRGEVPSILSNAKCPLMADDTAAMARAFLAGILCGRYELAGVGLQRLIGNSDQETEEVRLKVFRKWLSEQDSAD